MRELPASCAAAVATCADTADYTWVIYAAAIGTVLAVVGAVLLAARRTKR